MLLPNRHGSSDSYLYGFNNMEKDDEIYGEGNSYDFGARMYNSRLFRWFSPDPLASKYADYSPYVFALNNPILLIDPDGNEPVKPKVTGLKSFIRKVIAKNITTLASLYNEYQNDYVEASQENEVGGKRYLYSTRWGWVDLKHFTAAADYTDNILISGNKVLRKGEQVEREQQASGSGSAYSYEDLPSNILGVYFEEWLENDRTTEKEFDKLAEELGIKEETLVIYPNTKFKDRNRLALRMYKYFKELGFVDNPEDYKEYSKIADTEKDAAELRGLKNSRYTPKAETVIEPLDQEIDEKILERIKEFKKSKTKG